MVRGTEPSARSGVDPVCAMKVKLPARHHVTVAGSEVVFCSARCLDRYASVASARPTAGKPAAPGKPRVASTAPAAAAPGREPAREWTCPMHPEVRKPGPGPCPKCGMALEPAGASTGRGGDDGELRDMRRRLWIAVALTVPLVAVAMGGVLLSPMIAAAAMSLSSVSVIGNALRLRRAALGEV